MTHQAIPLRRGTYDPQFPRYVHPIPHEHKARAMGDPDAIFARDDLSARFSGPARHYRIGEPSLFAEIFAEPGSHLIVGLLGFAAGCFGTVGIAWLISMAAF
jgi:hypothetical protein